MQTFIGGRGSWRTVEEGTGVSNESGLFAKARIRSGKLGVTLLVSDRLGQVNM